MLIQELQKKADSFDDDSDKKQLLKSLSLVKLEQNPWKAFRILQEELGQTSFSEAIRAAFQHASSVEPPVAYRALWDLRIRGLINLNIDRLATRAFAAGSSNLPSEFTGGEATKLGYLLKDPHPFIINLHGIVDNQQSWVFTDTELSNLRREPSYHTFLQACLCSHTVVFLGLTVEDTAVGGHLEALEKQGIKSGPHYWITSRSDRATDRWAERLGVLVIRYEAHKDDHADLMEALRDLRSFVPPEDRPITAPVISSMVSTHVSALPSPEELAQLDSDEIRVLINSYVKELIAEGEIGVAKFAEFRRSYDEAIYRAWYISDKPGKNQFLGYMIQNAVKKGAFGSVYKALDGEGNECAIKLLLEDIRDNSDLTQSFRRGVTSMQILADRKVEGVVSYIDSSEIPAFVVMNWVEGPSLEEAVTSNQLNDWQTIIRCAYELTAILRKAHELPERVLHRDLRPANIMLEHFYSANNWRVVVLDFDLSWHRGASNRSVIYGSTVLGYLAPEQIVRTKGVSTRHGSVDVFGLGMLLYFLISHTNPLPSQHQHKDWEETVTRAAKSVRESTWKSIGARFARIILSATRHQQSMRWDLSQVHIELGRLRAAATQPNDVTNMDLIAEEVASHTDCMKGYEWDEDTNSARIQLPTGVGIAVMGDNSQERLSISITWQDTGVHQYQNVRKWLEPAAKSCEAILKSSGWETKSSIGQMVLQVEAGIDLRRMPPVGKVAAMIDSALEPLRRVG
jgi:serine/threonine protein kinase